MDSKTFTMHLGDVESPPFRHLVSAVITLKIALRTLRELKQKGKAVRTYMEDNAILTYARELGIRAHSFFSHTAALKERGQLKGKDKADNDRLFHQASQVLVFIHRLITEALDLDALHEPDATISLLSGMARPDIEKLRQALQDQVESSVLDLERTHFMALKTVLDVKLGDPSRSQSKVTSAPDESNLRQAYTSAREKTDRERLFRMAKEEQLKRSALMTAERKKLYKYLDRAGASEPAKTSTMGKVIEKDAPPAGRRLPITNNRQIREPNAEPRLNLPPPIIDISTIPIGEAMWFGKRKAPEQPANGSNQPINKKPRTDIVVAEKQPDIAASTEFTDFATAIQATDVGVTTKKPANLVPATQPAASVKPDLTGSPPNPNTPDGFRYLYKQMSDFAKLNNPIHTNLDASRHLLGMIDDLRHSTLLPEIRNSKPQFVEYYTRQLKIAEAAHQKASQALSSAGPDDHEQLEELRVKASEAMIQVIHYTQILKNFDQHHAASLIRKTSFGDTLGYENRLKAFEIVESLDHQASVLQAILKFSDGTGVGASAAETADGALVI